MGGKKSKGEERRGEESVLSTTVLEWKVLLVGRYRKKGGISSVSFRFVCSAIGTCVLCLSCSSKCAAARSHPK